MHYWQRYKFWLISASVHASVIGMLLWHFSAPSITRGVVPYRPIVQAYVINQPTQHGAASPHEQSQLAITSRSQTQHANAHLNTTPSSHQPDMSDTRLKHILLALSQLIGRHLPSTQDNNPGKLIKIRFVLTPHGAIEDAHIIQSSGSAALDHMLLQHITHLPSWDLVPLSQGLAHPIQVIAPVVL
jgi:hypothetical protein